MAEDVFGILGTVVAGAYQVEAVVAEGGFGVVYRAHHSGFRANVALKCLKVPQQLSSAQEAQFLEQFRAEAELLFRLSAAINTVVRPLTIDAMTLPDGRFVPYMALEWLEGETLDAIAERRKAEGQPPLPLKKLVRMLTPVARALERAHNFQGPDGPISVVHRDLKPENIFVANVAGEEVVKILDFGIGKAKSVANQVAGRASQSESSFSSFTPAYGAPEQWVPRRYGQTGPWTDVWGLALTMVEVMAGRAVIDGDHAGMMGTALDPNRRPSPRNEGLDVPEAVEKVFLRALAVDPRDRYSDAGSFWNELLGALGMRHDGREGYSPPGRDARAEAGAIPRSETVEGVAFTPPTLKRHRVASGQHMATLPAAAAAAAGVYPDIEPARSGPAPGGIPDLGEIPDLAPAARPQPRAPARSSARPAPLANPMDFDDSPSQVSQIQLEVDLAPGERPSLRISPHPSRPDYPVVSGSRPDLPLPNTPALPSDLEPVRRLPSGQMPAVTAEVVRRPMSGSYPAAVPRSPLPTSHGSSPPTARSPSGMVQAVGSASAPNWPLSGMPVPPPTPQKAQPSPLWKIAPGAALILSSILVTLGDQWYASSSGEVFTIAGLRSTWIAGALMAIGVVVLAVRLLPSQKS